MFEKKGFELSMNVIVVSAIALVVLVVVVLIFTGKIRDTNTDLAKCETRGGNCDSARPCPSGSVEVRGECSTGVCCIPLT